MISCNNAAIVPYECHRIGAKSGNESLFLDSSSDAEQVGYRNEKRYRAFRGKMSEMVQVMFDGWD